ncbi:Nitrilase/cyanide hydratase and apolipoprotein N-acyltransferase [Thioalkalivibrio sp. K90mix]|uniref:carbon-nitrogen hydrolase family protein n=1 Tax=Thioalkalivibrio sp. (strain K90mix) TaxID=396595 RepID=UPI0001959C33|nr:nitrilase-related carbon-nitrogen hydrolase [Thioalkalivibrio sp. K90mix]ADC72478.1 Nitrilase/cyanide hydratase and apolipoprotein N-acyltransferase [Thioalkalivibrio sp. K90mix]
MTQVAAIQMASGPQPQANLLEAKRLLQEAADKGARLAVLPENFAFMGMQETDVLGIAEAADGAGPLQAFLSEQARRLGLWIVGGTVPLQTVDGQRVRSACLVFDDQGQQVARYDKIHLFDVQLPDSSEAYTESKVFERGDKVVVVDTPVGRMGLAICYDLRFPELFRALLDQGADWVALPAAFTAQTGQAHWDVLLRARAIENQYYMLSSAQGGFHVNGRETYGHSALVDPWGRVVDQLQRNPGVLLADLDHAQVERIRTVFPTIEHRRLACPGTV